jgi:NAD(P)-dependent dehydrogenase (short-subunit alcohol dehydrogenase family)
MFSLEGKVSIITGGNSGIGLGIAEAFMSQGAKVCIIGQNEKRAEKAMDRLLAIGGDAFFIKADVGKEADVKDAIAETISRYGKLDIMVNNAGRIHQGLVVEQSEEDFDSIIRNNLYGVFFGSKHAAIQMIKQGVGGRIMNTSSIHSRISEPCASSYTASKGGIEAFTYTLASELAPYGITANILAVGAVYTNINRDMYTPPVVKALKERIPAGDIAYPKDIAPAAVYIASDEAWFMTGARICLDGGHEMDGSLQGAAFWEE